MNKIEIDTGIRVGALETECIIRGSDGKIKSIERCVRPVRFQLDQSGTQVVSMQEVK
jgi:hypothetical protein